MIPHIQTSTKSFITHYKEPEDFRDKQLQIFWPHYEIHVDNDVHDVIVNLSSSERHGVFTTLKLFAHYEVLAGEEYWTGRFMRIFPRHEFTGMASIFGATELCSHFPFYNKINVLLNAHDDGFYTDYVNNPVLLSRMTLINNIINSSDDLLSIAGFSLVEGAILYSNFAFLKHFQSLGKNKLVNIVSGINFSVRDENLHAIAGSWCFRELLRQKELHSVETDMLYANIERTAHRIYEHECKIIDMIFEHGEIDGIAPQELKIFVSNRIAYCLSSLGCSTFGWEKSEKDTISEWFYKGINNYQMNDFFNRKGREYVRGWNESKFIWK